MHFPRGKNIFVKLNHIFQLNTSQTEAADLRTNNQILSERLESLSRSYSSTSSVHMSLLNEMEMSTSGSDSDRSLYLRR